MTQQLEVDAIEPAEVGERKRSGGDHSAVSCVVAVLLACLTAAELVG